MHIIIKTLISLFFYITGGITFLITGLGFLFFSLFPNNIMFPYVKIICKAINISLGAWVKVEGTFPKKGPYVIMFNHGSFIDPFILASVIQGPFTAIIAAKNLKIPLFGTMIKKFKAIPIHRKNKKKAIESIKFAEQIITNDGYHVAILPEGTRTTDGKLKPFKKGGFHMAINTKTPILPIGACLPYTYKPKNRWTIKPSIITVRIGEPISIDKYENLGVNGLLKLTNKNIYDLTYGG